MGDTSDEPKYPERAPIQPFSSKHLLSLKPWYMDFFHFHFWQVLRPLPVGGAPKWLLLGELGKWVPMSADRVQKVESTSELLRVSVRGKVWEQVTFSFVELENGLKLGERRSLSCIVSDTGSVVFELHAMKCSSAAMLI